MQTEEIVDEAPAPAGAPESGVEVVDAPKDADGCLVVDASNLAYRSFHAYNLTAKDGRASGHIYGSVRLLMSTMRNDLDAGRWCPIFCYDGAGAKEVRQAILPAYKSNRDDGRFNPVPEAREVLIDIPGLHVEQPGREGDDAIAWIVEKIASSGQKVVVLTGDRDMWQLKRFPSVQILSPNLKRYVIPQDILDHYHVEDPARIPLAKMLFGDPSDGIKGVDRLQKKSVAPLMNRADITDADAFFHRLGEGGAEVAKMTNKTQAKIAVAEAQLRKNWTVIQPMLEGFGRESVRRTLKSPGAQESLRNKLLSYDCVALADMLGVLFT